MQHISPSNIPVQWEGTPVENSPYTVQQHHTLSRLKQGRMDFDAVDIPLFERDRRSGILHSEPHSYAKCPVLARTRDGARVKIITPGGDVVWQNTPRKRA